ncbi:MAG: serine/threonine protein kinase [Candidatus Obscuribacterales bacterium]|nr:serine/threonine protein kinase [Candidatus Obscuribacterales bacterium]
MSSELKPGTVVDDRYEIVEHLGDGGMGSVYKARERGLERFIALKMLHRSLVGDQEHLDRFRREGAVLATLEHPHILQCYRFGVWQGMLPYISMEYIVGRSLSSVIADAGKVPLERVLTLGQQICAAMEHAHQHKVVHRDLKPANIMVIQGERGDVVKVLDFGLAKILRDDGAVSQHLTQTGSLVGSVYYMSPEQCLGKKADLRSDIYSLGCLLYEALTGAPPLMADTPVGLIYLHVNSTPESLANHFLKSELRDGLNDALMRSLAKDPADRYQSMEDFRAALSLVQQGRGSEILPVPAGAALKSSRKQLVTVLARVSLLLVFATAIVRYLQLSEGDSSKVLASLAKVSSGTGGEPSENLDPSVETRVHVEPRELAKLEQAVAHAGGFAHMKDSERKEKAALALLKDLNALQNAYWFSDRFDDWYALNRRKAECNMVIADGERLQVEVLANTFQRCYQIGRQSGTSAVKDLWNERANGAYRELMELEKVNPYAMFARCQINTVGCIRKRRFANAKVAFLSAWPPPVESCSTREAAPHCMSGWCKGMVEQSVGYLLQAKPAWRNREEALTLCEIIAPMAAYLEVQGDLSLVGQKAKLYCALILRKAHVMQTPELAQRKRAASVLETLKIPEAKL